MLQRLSTSGTLYITSILLAISIIFLSAKNPLEGNSDKANNISSKNIIQLETLNATIIDKQLVFTWKTISEKNYSYFIIEKSFNGASFIEISKTNATGNHAIGTEYTAKENNLPIQTAYYRLAHVDSEGKSEYSDMLVIAGQKNASPGCKANIEPNPCLGKCAVSFKNCNISNFDFEVFDFLGNSILTNLDNKQVPAGLQFDTENYLKPGIFISKVNFAKNTAAKTLQRNK